MDEGAAVGAAAVETDVLDNVQGAEDSRKHAFGNESLAQQVANHKIQLRVIQNFADFGNRRVGQVDQRIFKNFKSPMQTARTTKVGVNRLDVYS